MYICGVTFCNSAVTTRRYGHPMRIRLCKNIESHPPKYWYRESTGFPLSIVNTTILLKNRSGPYPLSIAYDDLVQIPLSVAYIGQCHGRTKSYSEPTSSSHCKSAAPVQRALSLQGALPKAGSVSWGWAAVPKALLTPLSIVNVLKKWKGQDPLSIEIRICIDI